MRPGDSSLQLAVRFARMSILSVASPSEALKKKKSVSESKQFRFKDERRLHSRQLDFSIWLAPGTFLRKILVNTLKAFIKMFNLLLIKTRIWTN